MKYTEEELLMPIEKLKKDDSREEDEKKRSRAADSVCSTFMKQGRQFSIPRAQAGDSSPACVSRLKI